MHKHERMCEWGWMKGAVRNILSAYLLIVPWPPNWTALRIGTRAANKKSKGRLILSLSERLFGYRPQHKGKEWPHLIVWHWWDTLKILSCSSFQMMYHGSPRFHMKKWFSYLHGKLVPTLSFPASPLLPASIMPDRIGNSASENMQEVSAVLESLMSCELEHRKSQGHRNLVFVPSLWTSLPVWLFV